MGIKIINNFDPDFGQPLDGRIIADTLTDLATLISGGKAYEGMLVYVKDAGAGTPGSYQYSNIAVLPIVDLQWIPFSGGGGTNIHNDLTGVQGGIDNTEYFHLNQRQWQWVVDSVPFTPPTGSVASNEGPTWVYQEIIDQPVIFSGSVVQFEGIDVFARLVDSSNNPLNTGDIDADPNGWVPVTGSRIITYTFPTVPTPNTTVPVNTNTVNGDTAIYKLEVKYKNLDLISQGFTKILTYISRKRETDEIWWPPEGLQLHPGFTPPDLGGDMKKATKSEAGGGLTSDLGLSGKFVAYVVSDDLTGGDPSKIQVIQNNNIVYQPGVVANTGWGVQIPYSGDRAASSDPNTTFIMVYTSSLQGGIQTYVIRIV